MSRFDKAVAETNLERFPLRSKGKVRDIYEVGDDLLLVATDRVSAFDVVLPSAIPDKGKVLNQLSMYWFGRTRDVVDNHVLTADVSEYPKELAGFAELLDKRSMLVKKLEPLPFECVVRGYLYGSGWKEYRQEGSVCGIPLAKGMRMADKFPEPLFTPSTKAESGHDVNVSRSVMAESLGEELTSQLERLSLDVYRLGRDEAEEKGIIIADTKFEFGRDPETKKLYLIDEVLTPDSSRFWPRETYSPGREQPSFDKQFVREYLETLDWNKQPPGPELPPDVIEGTRKRYLQAYETLTGRDRL